MVEEAKETEISQILNPQSKSILDALDKIVDEQVAELDKAINQYRSEIQTDSQATFQQINNGFSDIWAGIAELQKTEILRYRSIIAIFCVLLDGLDKVEQTSKEQAKLTALKTVRTQLRLLLRATEKTALRRWIRDNLGN